MVEYFEAILLGVVQGIAEFLPVSSSAHLIIVSWLTNGKPIPIEVNIALHVGTLSAVLIYFWKDWLNLTKATLRLIFHRKTSPETNVILPALLIGSIPAGICGILWEKKIEATFHHPAMTIAPLAIMGVLLWWVDKRWPNEKSLTDLSWKGAFIIGLGQALALIPGVSRSGSTITFGRFLNLNKVDAARFSFFLGTPAMLGAAVLNARELIDNFHRPLFFIGVLTSMLVGCLAISFLMRFIRTNSFLPFAIYRILLAVVIGVVIFYQ